MVNLVLVILLSVLYVLTAFFLIYGAHKVGIIVLMFVFVLVIVFVFVLFVFVLFVFVLSLSLSLFMALIRWGSLSLCLSCNMNDTFGD